MKRLRHIIFDLIGVTLIALSPTLGWLPGPGGIPLLLAGLGFLSINHNWAKKLVVYVKENGIKLGKFIFHEHPAVQAAYDIFSVLFMGIGIYLISTYTQNLTLAVAIVLLFTALTLFLGNRKRLDTFSRWLKNKLK
ncbi:MAG: hypothetical protein U5L95_02800 [Candidatus Saccharibacteria bacterium]|nr:hypothetical protein [Candidatus Saccharibacteria bacterium]